MTVRAAYRAQQPAPFGTAGPEPQRPSTMASRNGVRGAPGGCRKRFRPCPNFTQPQEQAVLSLHHFSISFLTEILLRDQKPPHFVALHEHTPAVLSSPDSPFHPCRLADRSSETKEHSPGPKPCFTLTELCQTSDRSRRSSFPRASTRCFSAREISFPTRSSSTKSFQKVKKMKPSAYRKK